MAAGGPNPDDLGRLASRIAMLASDPGEAANAGRAAGAMARRLGLSGGDLKEIFLAGARSHSSARRLLGDGDLARENEALREHLDIAEIATQQAIRERDRLRREVTELRGALQSRRRNDVLAMVIGVVLVGLATLGGAWFLATPGAPGGGSDQSRRSAAAAALAAGEQLATVRLHGAAVHDQPEPDSPVLARLAGGSRVRVERLVWHSLLQWAEIDLGDRSGFVETTDLQL